MPAGTVLLLHACCHNPTGADLSPDQWQDLAGLIADRRLPVVLDMAYAGFAEGLEADSAPARLLARSGLPLFVATSFSKSFGLYGERVGALSIVAADAKQAALVHDQAKVAIRTNYSTPPSHGAMLVSAILTDPSAAPSLGDRTGSHAPTDPADAPRPGRPLGGSNRADFTRLIRQRGLFSYSGLSADQMTRLKQDFGIYGVSDGRLCMAALTQNTLDRVAEGIRAVS